MKGESQKRDLTSSWKVVKLKGRNLQLETPRPYSKVIQNLWQKKSDYWLLEMTLHQAVSHLNKFNSSLFSMFWSKRPQPNSRERSAIGPEANPTRPIQSFGEVDAHPRKQNSRPGVDCESRRSAGSRKWLACCPPRAIHSKAQRRKWVILWQFVFKNDHTSDSDIRYTRILKELKEVNTGGWYWFC